MLDLQSLVIHFTEMNGSVPETSHSEIRIFQLSIKFFRRLTFSSSVKQSAISYVKMNIYLIQL